MLSSRRLQGFVPNTPLGRVRLAGGLFVLLYALFFLLMQSHTLWESPTLIPDRWPAIFQPLKHLFPEAWVSADRATPLGLLNAALYLLLLACLFATYLWTVSEVFKLRGLSRRTALRAFNAVWLVAVAALLLLLLLPGMLSSDLFVYIWYGRIAGVYGGNPFLRPPMAYAQLDPGHWMQWTVWKDTTSVYGPVWVVLASLIAGIAHVLDDDIVTHLLGHRLLAVSAQLVNIWLMWKVSALVVARFWGRGNASAANETNSDEEEWRWGKRFAITLAFAWNPLLLIEFGASAHNDVLLLTGMIAVLWLHLSGRWRLAVLALALASLVKLIALIFLPAYLLLIFRENARSETRRRGVVAVSQAIVITVVTWVVCYLPFWAGPSIFDSVTGGPPATYFTHSLATILRLRVPELLAPLAQALGLQPSSFWTVDAIGSRLDFPARWLPLAFAGCFILYRAWKVRDFPSLLWAWAWSAFVYLTIGSVWFWPWYVSWLLVPVVLIGPSRLFLATQILCLTSLGMYAVFPRILTSLDWLMRWNGLLIMAPPLLYLGLSRWMERRRRSEWATDTPLPTRDPDKRLLTTDY